MMAKVTVLKLFCKEGVKNATRILPMWDYLLIFAVEKTKRKGSFMNAASLNNLWIYLESVLTADDQKWLGDKLIESSGVKNAAASEKKTAYRLSSRRKRIMDHVVVAPHDFVNDERAQYILSK